jgi:para-nitrobenzyl esterase
MLAVRTLANPEDSADMRAAHAAQDGIKLEQAGVGKFEIPNWDLKLQDRVRAAINGLAPYATGFATPRFGAKDEVDPILHFIGTATGWGANPRSAAVYEGVYPKANDGTTVHKLTVKDVPVDGFWSISVYNAKGYFQKNGLGAYSLNNLTAKPNPDGSFTIQFGGCRKATPNCLPIMRGWNYTVRLYRPRREIVDGTWRTPEAQPVP